MALQEKGDGTLANAAMAELEKKAEVILNMFHDLIETCPADDISAHGEAKAKADDDMNRRQLACMQYVLALPSHIESKTRSTRSSTAAAADATSASRIVFREQTGLRPDTITVESSMTEYEAWKDAFSAYFHASNMQLLGADQQGAFLRNRLGPLLRIRLKGTVRTSA